MQNAEITREKRPRRAKAEKQLKLGTADYTTAEYAKYAENGTTDHGLQDYRRKLKAGIRLFLGAFVQPGANLTAGMSLT
jgi:hypothetical protein